MYATLKQLLELKKEADLARIHVMVGESQNGFTLYVWSEDPMKERSARPRTFDDRAVAYVRDRVTHFFNVKVVKGSQPLPQTQA